ncbi:MAG TPA: trypsin-like peptidase domain-containing protein [Gaiellaceae bacterium]|nr:trypsin-like peptidase domain-containing protein [Gaiellaceae bacterium]
MRVAAVAFAGALVGAAAVLGIGRAAGLIDGGSTTRTVVVRELPAAASRPAAVRTVIPSTTRGFSPARIFALRSPGVVTVFTYFADGTAAQGSGFVVSPSGTILTNAHVITTAGETAAGVPVRAASRIYVEFADHDRIPARVVGWDVYDDVGVIRVAASQHALDPLPLGRSSAVVVGEPVAAIGSPLGNENSLAVGVVSAVGRSIAALTAAHFQLVDAIQTDAPITHGSSGGPLLDGRGRVIGINAQIRSDSGGSSGIGFAVPIDSARRSLVDLLAHGRVAYAYAGLQTQDLTPSLARHLGLPVLHGALVEHVTSGGPAAHAGVRGGSKEIQFEGESLLTGGDVVVSVDGAPVPDADTLVRIVTSELRPGQTAVFGIVRGGTRRTVAVRLAERPSSR